MGENNKMNMRPADIDLSELDRLDALAEKATPGTWLWQYDDNGFFYVITDQHKEMPSPYIVATGGEGDADHDNAAYIAAMSPEAARALIHMARKGMEATAKPDNNGWIDRSAFMKADLDVKLMERVHTPASELRWSHRGALSDIIAYKPLPFNPEATHERHAVGRRAEQVAFQDMEFLKENGEVGDCVRACTASILGIDRSEVPHFVRDHSGDWKWPWREFIEAKGYEIVEVDPRLRPDCRYLACGPTERSVGDGTASHMVLMEWNGLLHDPHPSRKGLTGVDRVYLLVPKLYAAPPAPKPGAVTEGMLDGYRALDPSPFITANSGAGDYFVTIKVNSMEALHAAHNLVLKAYQSALSGQGGDDAH